MSRTTAGAKTNSLHRVLADWGEGASNAGGNEGGGAGSAAGDATWIHTFFNASLWTTPGGDYVGAASASQSVAGIGSYTWSGPGLVADVQMWVDSLAVDYGWILIGDEGSGGTTKRYNSGNNKTSPPQLVVDYTPPSVAIEERTWGGVKAIYKEE
jgi:hypothetical protein